MSHSRNIGTSVDSVWDSSIASDFGIYGLRLVTKKQHLFFTQGLMKVALNQADGVLWCSMQVEMRSGRHRPAPAIY